MTAAKPCPFGDTVMDAVSISKKPLTMLGEGLRSNGRRKHEGEPVNLERSAKARTFPLDYRHVEAYHPLHHPIFVLSPTDCTVSGSEA